MRTPKICVIGAANLDLIAYVPRMPRKGETLHGRRFHMGFGGKGANQAVMAAKLGADVTMITKLGNDIFGENTLANFKKMGVKTDFVYFTDQAFSGVAPIFVDSEGDNYIVIITGANDLLTEEEIEKAADAIAGCQILICQLEIPLRLSLKALKIAHDAGVRTIFNPAPGRADIPQECFQLSDIVCPNETETELLTGISIHTNDEAEKAGRFLLERGAKSAVITLGERGSLYVSYDECFQVPAPRVKAFDTTGAGDAFVGSLAYFLGIGKSVQEAMERASAIASISVQHPGTQVSFPNAEDLPENLLR